MTLGQLRAKLLEIGIRQVATMSRSDRGDGLPSHTFTFTADEKVVFPFAMKTTYFLTLDAKDDSTRVNSEKVKALMRAIKRDRESSEFDPTWFTM
jgi:hypothetical protein